MQVIDGQLVLSPTDVSKHLACQHLSVLDREVSSGQRTPSPREDAFFDVLTRRGSEHERNYLDELESEGLTIVTVETPRGQRTESLLAAENQTIEAMRSGADVIYQGTFFDGRWVGHADFLRRVERPSDLGDHSYEVEDTKLASRVKPAAVLQLCSYAQQLARLQGVEPERVHVVLGNRRRVSVGLADVAAYHRRVTSDFLSWFAEPTATYPDPVAHCSLCRWDPECTARRRDHDHLSFVAGIRASQIRRLADVGVTTLEDLGRTRLTSVTGIGDTPLDRLQAQARLQLMERDEGRRVYELVQPEAAAAGPGTTDGDGDGGPGAGRQPLRGLAMLPEPSPGDLFLDLEGDPFIGESGLEYLFGIVEMDQDGSHRFHAFWAHDLEEEKAAFEAVVDLIANRLSRYPDLRVYHYAEYERSAFRRLMGRHATREQEVDRLLRGEVFVDLYRVVQQGLRVSAESYSIKELEPLYMDKRAGAVTDATSSIIEYEEWLDTGDPQILEGIERYNEDDCVSTLLLRNWLEDRRAELEAQLGGPLPRPEPVTGEPSEAQQEAEAEVADLVSRLTDGVPTGVEDRTDDEHARWLLAQLLGYHRREAKSAWWAHFERLEMTPDELHEDAEAISGLEYVGTVGEVARSYVHRYRFDPAQEHKLRVGDSPIDAATEGGAGEIWSLDSRTGVVDLKRGKASRAPHPTALLPPKPILDTVKRAAVQRVAAAAIADGLGRSDRYEASAELLRARPPRLDDGVSEGPLQQPGEPEVDAARRLARLLSESCLPVQGPPGAGKTYTAARVIVDQVRAGNHVGVTALSHKAITNLLDETCTAAREEGISMRILQRVSDNSQACQDDMVEVADNDVIEAAIHDGDVDVVAGTSWLFSREGIEQALDVLVVDEASQLPLADAIAVSTAARNLLLVGDPQQLGQPSSGVHPEGAEVSALEHLLAGHATVPTERGLFLPETRRLHPAVCDFVSTVVYEGRLESHKHCSQQAVSGTDAWSGAGPRWAPVDHEGNRTSSTEEAEKVQEIVDELLGRTWTGFDGSTRDLTLDDIMIVAPYNAQVACLTEHLGGPADVGTVDRFQGRQAPVAIYSMATSTPGEAPRGMDFLYSLERLNVAVSRAQGLAIVVCSPQLLRPSCQTVHQMRLANALCRFVEMADQA